MNSEAGRTISVESATQIRPGVTTKATVQQLLGTPMNRTLASNGDETWLYMHSKSDTDAGVITAVMPLAAYLPNSIHSSMESQQVQIVFKGNVVSSCSIKISTVNTSGSVFQGSTATPDSSESDCANIARIMPHSN